jgi:Pre-mRNA splicing Prp18-interacting factor
MKTIQRFAAEAYEKAADSDMHLQAAPSQAEAFHREFKERKEQLKRQKESSMLQKYGGAQHLQSLPSELIYAQTEEYREYAPDGRVVKGLEKEAAKTKYEEDGMCECVYIGVCVCVCVCVCVWMNIRVCVHSCVGTSACVYIYMCVCIVYFSLYPENTPFSSFLLLDFSLYSLWHKQTQTHSYLSTLL